MDWIRNLRVRKCSFPVRFIDSIKKGKWMKTYSGFSSPIRCFLCKGAEISTLLRIGQNFVVLSAIDQEYYMDQIISFRDELKFLGVNIKSEDLYLLISNKIKHRASCGMTIRAAVSLLSFVRYSKYNNKLNDDFLKTLKEGKWLKTLKGYTAPSGSVSLASPFAEALAQITDLNVVDNMYYGRQLVSFMNELKFLGVLMDKGDVYKLLPEHFSFPEDLSTMIEDSALVLLESIRHLGPSALGLVEKLRCKPWIKTSSGFSFPSESLLSDSKWGNLLNMVPLPIIDEAFYGSGIKSYKVELEEMGVTVDLLGASKMVSAKLKLLSSSSKLTNTIVISLLNLLKHLGKAEPSLLPDIISSLSGEKWLKTSHGYNFAPDCILYDSKWKTVLQFVYLLLVDVAFYGPDIFLFKDELKMLGVVVDFSEGARFIAENLELPKEPALITPECALLLLRCFRSLRNSSKEGEQSLVKLFRIQLKGSKWIKTNIGYKSSENSLLFNPEWECSLELDDAPFVGQSFYGPLSALEKDDLKAIGVKADAEEVYSIIYQTLGSHVRTCAIVRIYKFLSKMKWSPKAEDISCARFWIPNLEFIDWGQWVSSCKCVLHDQSHLFGSHLYALDQYYDVELLSYFSSSFGVASTPSREYYVKLWNDWASCEHNVSHVELNSFWGYIAENWNKEMERTVGNEITMLPATAKAGKIQFLNKEQVFIPDDLQLKKSFTEATEIPLFVWFPRNGTSSVSPTKLSKIYRKIGVRKISEAVQVDSSADLGNCKSETMDLKHGLVGKGLTKIVLGFLASPLISMPVAERQKVASSLIDFSVFGSNEPITVHYGLHLHTLQRNLYVEITRMVFWEKNNRRLFVHKPSWESGNKNMELVTNFAQAISEAVLPITDLVNRLFPIIKMAFAFGFREEDVDFLLVTENLELPPEDKEFVDQASARVEWQSSLKRSRSKFSNSVAPSKKRFTQED